MRTKQDARKRQARADVPFKDLKVQNAQNARDIKKALHNLLENIESGGSFATSGVYSEAPLPDLVFEGFGSIPLPLVERDADALCKERTEDGKESVPLLDKSVERTSGRLLQNQWYGKSLHNQWEMKTDKLAIRNPAWNKFVQRIAIKAAEDLGIKSDAEIVRAKIDRVCLWAVAASLTPYKEPSHVPGCFGKLLVCLPASHQGGELLVRYGGETKEFLTETHCSWSYSYFAWYGDVTLEFKPLGSGYRLMLEYDLIVPSTAKRPSPTHLYSEKDKVKDLLAAWSHSVKKDQATHNHNFPTLLAYICDSHYESESLSLKVLQGDDRLRAACLKDLCSQLGMGLYIADLKRSRSGFCESDLRSYGEDDHHYIDTEDEDDVDLIDLVDLNGNPVACGPSLDFIEVDEHFIQSDPFGDDPDEEEYDRYGYVTQVHWKTVLVLIPYAAKEEWLEESKESRPKKRKRSVEVIDLE